MMPIAPVEVKQITHKNPEEYGQTGHMSPREIDDITTTKQHRIELCGRFGL